MMDEYRISQSFVGYFNNKMTLLFFLIDAKKVRPSLRLVETVHGFLDDLFNYMLENPLQRKYRRTFQWLKLFFSKLPDVSTVHRNQAKQFIRTIYDAFGIHLKSDI
jgi:hypothetical protein